MDRPTTQVVTDTRRDVTGDIVGRQSMGTDGKQIKKIVLKKLFVLLFVTGEGYHFNGYFLDELLSRLFC